MTDRETFCQPRSFRLAKSRFAVGSGLGIAEPISSTGNALGPAEQCVRFYGRCQRGDAPMKDEWKRLLGQLDGIEARPAQALEYVRGCAEQGDAASVLAALDEFAVTQGFLMNVGPVKGVLLEEEAARAGTEARVLELGAHCGYSAILLARRLEGNGRLVSVDSSRVSVDATLGIVAFAGLADRVEVLCGDSTPTLPSLEGPFDFVFLDHWKGLYRTDLEAMESAGLLRPGSVVFADNVGPMFGADEYLAYVRDCGRYESRHLVSTVEYTEIEDAVEISTYLGP